MATNEVYDLVIVGGGPGGLTAGIYAMRAALKTVLVEKAAPGGQVTLSDEVENWPGTEQIGGAELAMNMANHAQAYGLEVRSNEVVAVEPGIEVHEVHLDSGETLNAHAVVLSCGGSPRKLGIPGENDYYGKGVSYCAVCDGFFFRGKTVMVIGGGDSAVEEASISPSWPRRSTSPTGATPCAPAASSSSAPWPTATSRSSGTPFPPKSAPTAAASTASP